MKGFFPALYALLRELQRRRVYRVGAIYAGAAFVVLQAADIVLPSLRAPPWVVPLLVLIAAGAFPVVLILAWALELTPQGLRVDHGSDSLRGFARVRLGLAFFVAMTCFAVSVAAWQLWLHPASVSASGTIAAEISPAELDPADIAVLYFDDHSPEGNLGYLADGLTEDLLHELAQVSAIRVRSRHAVKPFRGAAVSLDSIVRDLGVGSLVEGSVTRSQGLIRVSVQLIDGASGSHLESRIIEREEGELFALQRDLAIRVADALRTRLGRAIRLRERQDAANSPTAWVLTRLGDQARDDYQATWRSDADAGRRLLLRADSLYARAASLDPDWIEPILQRGWLAQSFALLEGPLSGTLDSEWAGTALQHAEHALRRWPDHPAALELRGVLRLGLANHPDATSPARLRRDAEADLTRAVRLDSRRARSWSALSELLVEETRFAEALRAAEHAFEADAFLERAADVMHTAYHAALQLGPGDDAVHWCHEGRRRFPRSSNFVVCRLFLLASFPQFEPDLDNAWALLDTLLSNVSVQNREDFRAFGTVQVAKVAARAGMRDSARAILRLARGAETPAWLAYDEAHARLLLDERGPALDLLRTSLGYDPDTAYLARDWWFTPLREDPRFVRLVGLER